MEWTLVITWHLLCFSQFVLTRLFHFPTTTKWHWFLSYIFSVATFETSICNFGTFRKNLTKLCNSCLVKEYCASSRSDYNYPKDLHNGLKNILNSHSHISVDFSKYIHKIFKAWTLQRNLVKKIQNLFIGLPFPFCQKNIPTTGSLCISSFHN